MQQCIRMTWLGTAGVLISDGETRLLIDPYVSRFSMEQVFSNLELEPDRALIRQWAEKLGAKNISAILVTHSHFDHVADAPWFAMETGAPLVGTESTLNIGRGAGLPESSLRKIDPGQAMTFGNFTVKFIESAHALFQGAVPYPGVIEAPLVQPAAAESYRLGGIFSLLIQHPSGSVIHHGSAAFKPGMYEGIVGDVLLLAITGIADMEDYLEQVVLKPHAKIVIPVHMDNFFEPLEKGMLYLSGADVDNFCRAAEKYRGRFTLRMAPFCGEGSILPLGGGQSRPE